MSKLRRYPSGGSPVFVTSVTFERRPLLLGMEGTLWEAIRRVQKKLDFSLTAWAILPDHFHAIIDSPDQPCSKILQRIKTSFTSLYRQNSDEPDRIWQHRFWDHVIRNESDLNRHIDYIHYNPVSHGLVSDPCEYQHSSIHQFVSDGGILTDYENVTEMNVGFGE